MIAELSPGLIVIFGALLIPLVPQTGKLRNIYMLALPILGALQMLTHEHGDFAQVQVFDYTLTLFRLDRLSFLFGLVFHMAALLGVIFALHMRDTVQQVAGLVYAGAGIGAIFVGDMISLFVFWELSALGSVFLIWASRSERAFAAGMRYLIIQVGSGVILLAGVIIYAQQRGDIHFGHLGLVDLPTTLIFIAFGIKCAFPLLHNWLQDAYPEGTVTGTVMLSAFTTKLAVYALARGYAGTEILIYIGAVMTAFPVFFAVIENDLRRVLAYSLNNQLGFMVVGIGVGTELALNGTAAHAFAHILYKALLFMSMGAVLYRTGTCKASELGGLHKSMPWTTGFCIVGAASISAFPLFSGFISKALILTATAGEGYWGVWLVLVFASAGVLEHSGIKIPYFAFYAHDSGIRVKEAPGNMLLAMGITAFLCIFIGVFPGTLYAILPYPVDFSPYTVAHVITQLQLLLFAMLAFALLIRSGLYPAEMRSTVLNTDWIYRRALPRVICWLMSLGTKLRDGVVFRNQRRLDRLLAAVFRTHGPQGILARTLPPGTTTLWVAILLGFTLILYYI
jgi:multicomponent Na+:H+ antiporter subunit D